jgi:hypothetical protein
MYSGNTNIFTGRSIEPHEIVFRDAILDTNTGKLTIGDNVYYVPDKPTNIKIVDNTLFAYYGNKIKLYELGEQLVKKSGFDIFWFNGIKRYIEKEIRGYHAEPSNGIHKSWVSCKNCKHYLGT